MPADPFDVRRTGVGEHDQAIAGLLEPIDQRQQGIIESEDVRGGSHQRFLVNRAADLTLEFLPHRSRVDLTPLESLLQPRVPQPFPNLPTRRTADLAHRLEHPVVREVNQDPAHVENDTAYCHLPSHWRIDTLFTAILECESRGVRQAAARS